MSDLISVWDEVEGNVRAFVIASSNIFTFSAGADIKEFTKMSPDAEGADMVESVHRFMRGIEQSSTVTIAAVNSIAFGGGCELTMACDFRIAAESATFGQPEINLGIMPGFGGTQRLPRLVGESKALEMNLTGDPIDAYEAYRVGLANEVVPDHELFDTALAWARKLAQKPPLAVGEIKMTSHRADLDEGLAAEAEGFLRVFGSDDAKEGISAFLQKRQPKFRGRGGRPRPAPPGWRTCCATRSAPSRSRERASPYPPASRTSAVPGAGSGKTTTRWRSRTSTPGGVTRTASGGSTATASRRSSTSSPTGRTWRWPNSSGAAS
jgi:enoyl-CoA hydratase/carnithine racemase